MCSGTKCFVGSGLRTPSISLRLVTRGELRVSNTLDKISPPRKMCWTQFKNIGHISKNLDPSLNQGTQPGNCFLTEVFKSCYIVRCNIKLQSFFHPRRHQLGAALTRKNFCANSKIPSISLE